MPFISDTPLPQSPSASKRQAARSHAGKAQNQVPQALWAPSGHAARFVRGAEWSDVSALRVAGLVGFPRDHKGAPELGGTVVTEGQAAGGARQPEPLPTASVFGDRGSL